MHAALFSLGQEFWNAYDNCIASSQWQVDTLSSFFFFFFVVCSSKMTAKLLKARISCYPCYLLLNVWENILRYRHNYKFLKSLKWKFTSIDLSKRNPNFTKCFGSTGGINRPFYKSLSNFSVFTEFKGDIFNRVDEFSLTCPTKKVERKLGNFVIWMITLQLGLYPQTKR